jgi:hypothetical protein
VNQGLALEPQRAARRVLRRLRLSANPPLGDFESKSDAPCYIIARESIRSRISRYDRDCCSPHTLLSHRDTLNAAAFRSHNARDDEIGYLFLAEFLLVHNWYIQFFVFLAASEWQEMFWVQRNVSELFLPFTDESLLILGNNAQLVGRSLQYCDWFCTIKIWSWIKFS